MVRANKFGTASMVFLALAVLPPYENWKQPVNALLVFVSFVPAYNAGRAGKPAWFALCIGLVGLLGALTYFALESV